MWISGFIDEKRITWTLFLLFALPTLLLACSFGALLWFKVSEQRQQGRKTAWYWFLLYGLPALLFACFFLWLLWVLWFIVLS